MQRKPLPFDVVRELEDGPSREPQELRLVDLQIAPDKGRDGRTVDLVYDGLDEISGSFTEELHEFRDASNAGRVDCLDGLLSPFGGN